MSKELVYFRNNSKNEWLDYKIGGGNSVDIFANCVFALGPKAAQIIIDNLCDKLTDKEIAEGKKANWIEQISKEEFEKTKKENKEVVKENVEKEDKVEKKKIEEEEKKQAAKNKKRG